MDLQVTKLPLPNRATNVSDLILRNEKIKDWKTQNEKSARHLWFTPVILAIQEALIRRISVQSQLGANSL
jgi:hypothetical protein